MIDALFAASNAPFAVALLVMLGLTVIEVVGMLAGIAVSRVVDSVMPDALSGPGGVDVDPDFDMDADLDADVDMDLDADAGPSVAADHGGIASWFTAPLDWLRIGKVPFLVFLVILLTCFSLIGLGLQAAVTSNFGTPLPPTPASLAALALSLPVVRVAVGWIARIMPKVETSAVSRRSFVGRTAVVVTGTAVVGAPAQARLTDQHGQTHYVMIEPERDGDRFETGTTVLVTAGSGARFQAIRPAPGALAGAETET